MKTTITLKKLKSLGPCDGGRAFKVIFGATEAIPFTEAARVMDWEDIWWCISKLWDQLSKEQKNDIHLLGCEYAENVLHIFENEYPNDKRPRLAIEAKRKWVRGEISDEELRKVRLAAGEAARSAAETAARSAAETAAWAAARAAAGAAARAAWAAARSAAGAAGAAGAKQKGQLIGILEKWEECK